MHFTVRTVRLLLSCLSPYHSIFVVLGVLWIDNNAIAGAAEAMNHFRKLGKKIFYVTNNSTKIRSDFAAKATQLGFIASPVRLSSYLLLQAF